MCHHTRLLLFFILYFETGSHEVAEGLTKETETETETETGRERERAEAGHEPGSSGLRLPKYWDYKRAPPLPAQILFLYMSTKQKMKMFVLSGFLLLLLAAHLFIKSLSGASGI